MLERNHRYSDAEVLLQDQAARSKNNELITAFYDRMLELYPDTREWYYKGGVFFYNIAAQHPDPKEKLPGQVDNSSWTDTHQQELFNDTTGDATITIPYQQQAIDLLTDAAKLSQQDENVLTDICSKLGDLYTWARVPGKASRYFKLALHLDPNNAAIRMKLVDISSQSFHFSSAMEQLDSLYNRREINTAHQKLLATYSIYSRRFAKADSLLQDIKEKMIIQDTQITELEGRLQLLSDHPKKALAIYMEYLAMNPSDASTMYTIARIHLQLHDEPEAWKWLEAALNTGFAYHHVLANDPNWEAYRSSPQWQKLKERFPALR